MRRFATVRARITLGATVIVALALGVAAIGLVAVLRHTMLNSVDAGLELRVQDLSALLEEDSDVSDLAIIDESDSFVQIVRNGSVVAGSRNVLGEPPISDATPSAFTTMDDNPVDDSRFRVLVARPRTTPGGATIIVGATLEPVDETIRATVLALAVGTPLLAAFLATITWIVVGRALRPVEAIRAEVAEIGSSDLHRRVPDPGGDDEVGRLAETMNDMLDRIEAGSERQRRFVSDASHELRTPIATIRHELEVALQAPATDWPATAASVLDEDLRLQRLIDDLLWLARHDSSPNERATELVDLDEVVLRQTRRQALRPGLSLDTSRVSAGQVRGNADDLARVVQNLIDNAVRHADHQVAVTLTSDRGLVRLDVDDDGPGVPEAMRGAIFERFTRSDEARSRDAGGSGLGLAIASEIVAQHNGTLVVTDSPLGGARFTATLPDTRA